MGQDTFEPLGIGAGSLIDGRYDVMERIGSGAMSAVYRVLDRSVKNDIIALKLFSPALTSDPTLLDRFRNEVSITRKLTHTNIVRTYDFGKTDQAYYYMTMELVSGASLDQVIRYHGHLTFEDSQRILRQILLAVGFAHSLGVVHRDLKPANLIISEKGELKIADFGLAQTQNMNMGLTKAGECVGTPFYMSPEQIQGEEVDNRSDLYSIGVIAYELVTSEVPFHSDNWYELASQIITQPLPPFTRKLKKIPNWFRVFVETATAKSANERYESAEAMLNALTEFFGDTEVKPLPRVNHSVAVVRRSPAGAGIATHVLPELGSKRSRVVSTALVGIAFSFILLAIGFIAFVPRAKIEEATVTIDSGVDKINKAANAIMKLTNAVKEIAEHQEEIDAALEKQKKEEQK